MEHGSEQNKNLEEVAILLTEEINEYMRAIEDVKESGADIELCVLKYIRDKKIPLSYRWSLFENMPDFWKEYDSSIPSFPVEHKLEIDWWELFCYSKYEIVSSVDFIERFDGYGGELIDSCFAEAGWTLELKHELMENILEQNLGSFKLDW